MDEHQYDRELNALQTVLTAISKLMNPSPDIEIRDGAVWVDNRWSIKPMSDDMSDYTYLFFDYENCIQESFLDLITSAIDLMEYYVWHIREKVICEALLENGYEEFIDEYRDAYYDPSS